MCLCVFTTRHKIYHFYKVFAVSHSIRIKCNRTAHKTRYAWPTTQTRLVFTTKCRAPTDEWVSALFYVVPETMCFLTSSQPSHTSNESLDEKRTEESTRDRMSIRILSARNRRRTHIYLKAYQLNAIWYYYYTHTHSHSHIIR